MFCYHAFAFIIKKHVVVVKFVDSVFNLHILLKMHRSTCQGPESDGFRHAWPGPASQSHVFLIPDSTEPLVLEFVFRFFAVFSTLDYVA